MCQEELDNQRREQQSNYSSSKSKRWNNDWLIKELRTRVLRAARSVELAQQQTRPTPKLGPGLAEIV